MAQSWLSRAAGVEEQEMVDNLLKIVDKIENLSSTSCRRISKLQTLMVNTVEKENNFEWHLPPSINFFLSVDCALKCVDILHYCINTVRDSVTRFFCWPRLFHGSNPSGTLVHMLKYFLNGLDFAEKFSVCKTPWCHWHRGLMLDWIRISQRNWSHI